MSDVTRILSAIEQGDSNATQQLLPLIYQELRKLAAAKLAKEKPGHTLQATALVNEAFQTLKDPVRRGRYLLDLRGIDMGEETDTAMDPAFLMEQMELRENLDEIRQADNPGKQLAELANQIDQRMLEKIVQLRGALNLDSSKETSRARNLVREMQFLQKMHHEIDNLEEELT